MKNEHEQSALLFSKHFSDLFSKIILNKHHKFTRNDLQGLWEKSVVHQIAVYVKQSVCSESIHGHLNHRWCSALRGLTTRVIWYIETVKLRKATWESYFKISYVVSLLSNTSFQCTGKHVENISLDMFLSTTRKGERDIYSPWDWYPSAINDF